MKAVGIVLAIVMGMMSGMTGAHAEDAVASQVSTSEAEDYVGIWKIELEVMGFKIELFLNFVDVEGQLGCTLDTPQSAEPLAISSIEKVDDRLDLNSELNFAGAITIDININVGLEGDKLVGSLADKGGLIKSEIEAVRIEKEDLDSVQGRRPDPTETRMNVDGKKVRIQFAKLTKDTSDWDLFQEMKAGDVQRFTLSRATKLYTDFDLDFNGTIVKTANYDEKYPGVYSLWLKKTDSGWSLIFNSWPDIWGTSYDSEFDVAEIPLTLGEVEGESQEKFVMKLNPTDGGAELTMAWGTQQWSTNFKLGKSL
jgi:hypothetical protein